MDVDRSLSSMVSDQNECLNTSFTLPRLPYYYRPVTSNLDHCGSYNNVLRECNTESDQTNTWSQEKRTQTPDFNDQYAHHAALPSHERCSQQNCSQEHCGANQLVASSEYTVHCAQVSPCNQLTQSSTLFYCDQACFPSK